MENMRRGSNAGGPYCSGGRAVRIPADAIAQFIERNTIPAKEERR